MPQSGDKRILVIGAGPAGLAIICQIQILRSQGYDVPTMSCYEKQSKWGGQWNFTNRTGIDERGEPVHSCMYRGMITNTPKETVEFPDYTFDEHFGGKPMPSYLTRKEMFDYLQARWRKYVSKDAIKFNTLAKSVEFDESAKVFRVRCHDLKTDVALDPVEFDSVLCCSGHFSCPQLPSHDGAEHFEGRILHSRDYRNAGEFRGLRVVVVGASFSAEDISCQLGRAVGGARKVFVSHRRPTPIGHNWPPGIVEERPELKSFSAAGVEFVDGTREEAIDAVVLATGYVHHYPFMQEDLRLRGKNAFHFGSLYKGVMWRSGPAALIGRLFYVGALPQIYTMPQFEVQARWALMVIMGSISVPSADEIRRDCDAWADARADCQGLAGLVDFQTKYLEMLGYLTDYRHRLDFSPAFHKFLDDRRTDFSIFREQTFKSFFTGNESCKPSAN